jgi:hypothetical protein
MWGGTPPGGRAAAEATSWRCAIGAANPTLFQCYRRARSLIGEWLFADDQIDAVHDLQFDTIPRLGSAGFRIRHRAIDLGDDDVR